jgi:hypothetical protein
VYLIPVVYDGVHPFDHRLLQAGLCLRRLLCVALDDYLVVADEYAIDRLELELQVQRDFKQLTVARQFWPFNGVQPQVHPSSSSGR